MPVCRSTSPRSVPTSPSLAEGAAHFDGPGGSQVPDVVGAGRRRHPDQRRSPTAARSPRRSAGRMPSSPTAARPSPTCSAPTRAASCSAAARPPSPTTSRARWPRTGARRRGRRHPPRPRLEHPPVGAGGRGRRGHGALGRLRPRHRRALRGCRRRRALRAHPARRDHRGLEPHRHPDAGLPHRRPGPRGRRPALGRRRARHRPRLGRPRRRCAPTSGPARPTSSWARTAACSRPPPTLLETLHPDKLLPSTDAVPERFELGTLPYELMAGTTAAVDFIASLADLDGEAIRHPRGEAPTPARRAGGSGSSSG